MQLLGGSKILKCWNSHKENIKHIYTVDIDFHVFSTSQFQVILQPIMPSIQYVIIQIHLFHFNEHSIS